MKKSFPLFLFTILAIASLALVAGNGCATKLESGGAYAPVDASGNPLSQPDVAFYTVDGAFDLAYSTIEGAFLFERQNRAALWQLSPSIKHTLDSIRPQAWSATVRYGTARRVYMANPVPANLGLLQQILATTQQLAATATAAIPTPVIAPTSTPTPPTAPLRVAPAL